MPRRWAGHRGNTLSSPLFVLSFTPGKPTNFDCDVLGLRPSVLGNGLRRETTFESMLKGCSDSGKIRPAARWERKTRLLTTRRVYYDSKVLYESYEIEQQKNPAAPKFDFPRNLASAPDLETNVEETCLIIVGGGEISKFNLNSHGPVEDAHDEAGMRVGRWRGVKQAGRSRGWVVGNGMVGERKALESLSLPPAPLPSPTTSTTSYLLPLATPTASVITIGGADDLDSEDPTLGIFAPSLLSPTSCFRLLPPTRPVATDLALVVAAVALASNSTKASYDSDSCDCSSALPSFEALTGSRYSPRLILCPRSLAFDFSADKLEINTAELWASKLKDRGFRPLQIGFKSFTALRWDSNWAIDFLYESYWDFNTHWRTKSGSSIHGSRSLSDRFPAFDHRGPNGDRLNQANEHERVALKSTLKASTVKTMFEFNQVSNRGASRCRAVARDNEASNLDDNPMLQFNKVHSVISMPNLCLARAGFELTSFKTPC
ncbi:hypothetical protein C8R46DRAFT_1291709 [Mycena filopes]|nr:hypothetical protein C8R46DRAFT_1291709 [Mycena filopes]